MPKKESGVETAALQRDLRLEWLPIGSCATVRAGPLTEDVFEFGTALRLRRIVVGRPGVGGAGLAKRHPDDLD